jgi:hypothetical protein
LVVHAARGVILVATFQILPGEHPACKTMECLARAVAWAGVGAAQSAGLCDHRMSGRPRWVVRWWYRELTRCDGRGIGEPGNGSP